MKNVAMRMMSGLAAVALALAFTAVTADSAQAKGKSVQTEAKFISYDPEAKTVTVKVRKPGRGKDAKLVKKNKEAVFAVKPEGSVLTRTTVTINSQKAELADIPEGKTVNVYWRPDEKDRTILRARKIDMILSDEELQALHPNE